MTELAYLADLPSAYVRSFRAKVVSLPPGAVVLDRTFFYPTGGGQPADRGRLLGPGGPLEVTDVTRSGGIVLHRVRGPPLALRSLRPGEEVDGEIDWARRHAHMRLHTAQHLLSARVFLRDGLRTRRAVLGGRVASIDLDGILPEDALAPLADDMTLALASPREVRIRRVPRSEWEANPNAGRSGLVPLPPQVDPVRVVEIDTEDACPCGGTHVRRTDEIGPVTLGASRTGSGSSRLTLTLVGELSPTPLG